MENGEFYKNIGVRCYLDRVFENFENFYDRN